MNNPIEKYTEANRLAWNEAMPMHQAANKGKWDQRFSIPGYSVFENPELEQLKEMGIQGKDVVHPCCNNGVELMSLKNLGAKRCVGFDISDAAIDEATKRSEQTKVACEFLRTDVYEIDNTYNEAFDIVYVSIGCFGWLPDLRGFLIRMSKLLRENGRIFIYEQHPFADMLPSDGHPESDSLKIIEPYFKSEPYAENESLDYIGKTTYESKTKYRFVWTLSDILMGLIDGGFNLRFFKEYKEDISATHSRNEQAGIDIPLSYILVAEKSKHKTR